MKYLLDTDVVMKLFWCAVCILSCFGLIVFPVEPVGKILEKCLQSRQRLWPNPPQFLDTLADAIRTQQVRLSGLVH